MPVTAELPAYLEIIKMFLSFGTTGVVLIMWYFSMTQTREILKRYADDMAEIRQMYENNVILVKDYSEVASDLKEIIVLNTETLTRLSERMKQ